jgi:hypothetical protein
MSSPSWFETRLDRRVERCDCGASGAGRLPGDVARCLGRGSELREVDTEPKEAHR